jgi:putative ABC transport system permease protein
MQVAAFGTYVLSANTVQRRAREIVLRKLHGARGRDIGLLVLRETAVLMLAGGVIGLPVAALAISRYLASYVEHAPIGYWTLLFALALTLSIALLAIARHTWLAMRLPPADALRS